MELTINQSRLELVKGNIVEQTTDAIVNAANSALAGGGGHGHDGPAALAHIGPPDKVNLAAHAHDFLAAGGILFTQASSYGQEGFNGCMSAAVLAPAIGN